MISSNDHIELVCSKEFGCEDDAFLKLGESKIFIVYNFLQK